MLRSLTPLRLPSLRIFSNLILARLSTQWPHSFLKSHPTIFLKKTTKHSIFDPIQKTINLDSPIVDPESELFRTNEDDIFIAGYILFFPSYSGYFEKPGFFIENMYVRECYRKYGFGKILFSAVASQAAKMGFSTVDWLTVGWNVDAIDFYLGMGAYIMADVKRFRLSGNGLDAFASSEDADKFR